LLTALRIRSRRGSKKLKSSKPSAFSGCKWKWDSLLRKSRFLFFCRPGSAGVHARYGNNISHVSIKSLRHRTKRYQSNIDRLAGEDARAPRGKTFGCGSRPRWEIRGVIVLNFTLTHTRLQQSTEFLVVWWLLSGVDFV
jgi:hypothetical protein